MQYIQTQTNRDELTELLEDGGELELEGKNTEAEDVLVYIELVE